MTGTPSAPGHDRSPAPSHSGALSVKGAPPSFIRLALRHILLTGAASFAGRGVCHFCRVSGWFRLSSMTGSAFLKSVQSKGDIEGSACTQSATTRIYTLKTGHK